MADALRLKMAVALATRLARARVADCVGGGLQRGVGQTDRTGPLEPLLANMVSGGTTLPLSSSDRKSSAARWPAAARVQRMSTSTRRDFTPPRPLIQ